MKTIQLLFAAGVIILLFALPAARRTFIIHGNGIPRK
jgi:hypothetical protein